MCAVVTMLQIARVLAQRQRAASSAADELAVICTLRQLAQRRAFADWNFRCDQLLAQLIESLRAILLQLLLVALERFVVCMCGR